MEGNEALNVMTLYVLNCRNLVVKKKKNVVERSQKTKTKKARNERRIEVCASSFD